MSKFTQTHLHIKRHAHTHLNTQIQTHKTKQTYTQTHTHTHIQNKHTCTTYWGGSPIISDKQMGADVTDKQYISHDLRWGVVDAFIWIAFAALSQIPCVSKRGMHT